MKQPRPLQQAAVDEIIQHMKSKQCGTEPIVLDASVGAGKSLMIAMLNAHVTKNGGVAMSLARQAELVDQNSEEASEYGVKSSIFCASLNIKSIYYPAIYGSEGSVYRALTSELKDLKVDLLTLDECHGLNYDDDNTMYMKIIMELYRRNPKMRIAGFTGSPYRGLEPIVGDKFWKRSTQTDMSTSTLVEHGYLVDVQFGYPDTDDAEIDFSEFELKGDHNGNDYSEELINRVYQGEIQKTFAICEDLVQKTLDSNGVIIFAGSKLHTEQVKHGLELAGVSPDQIRIVTDDTSNKYRIEAKNSAKTGECKYFINIGVASVGWNVPRWTHAVYMRPVGSLVFLTQSIGRVLRPFLTGDDPAEFNAAGKSAEERKAILAASKKPYATVLDYAGVLDRLGHLYNNPMLEQAEYQRAKKEGKLIECPACMTQNSKHARRCIGPGSTWDGRCDHFWSFQECRKCGTKNDVTAQECRNPGCRAMLRDPAKALLGKSYTDAELTAVHKMEVIPTKNDGVLIKYIVADPHEQQGHPTEFYSLKSPAGKKIWQSKFLKEHIRDPQWRYRFGGYSNQAVMKNKAMLDVPTHIAFRINDKNRFVIGRKLFRSGREESEAS